MDRATDFGFLESEEFDGLSLDEKFAYVNVLCAEVLSAGMPGAQEADPEEPEVPK